MGVSTLPEVGFLPGMTMFYAGAVAPAGWLLCDGALLNQADYPTLFAAIGTAYNTGGETGAQFRLPNVKGKVIAGLDAAQTEFDVLGESGGSKTSTAAHTHGLSAHTHTLSTGGPSDNVTNTINWRETNGHWPSTNSSGTVSSWHRHHIGHWHLASTSALLWNGTQNHGHHDRGGSAAEGPWEGANWTGGTSVDVNGTARGSHGGDDWSGDPNNNHSHDLQNHWHTIPQHDHGMKSHSHSGTSAGPSNDTSGASSAGAAAGNLQPYLTMNCIIKI